ncbi:hypothetical protein BH11PLA2_BH11PLA2_31180 [soil metagenome]
MFLRLAIFSLMLPGLLLSPLAALGHWHGGPTSDNHILRPHTHLVLSLGHDHLEEPHTHHDQDNDEDDDDDEFENASVVSKLNEPQDHDADAIYVNVMDSIAGVSKLVPVDYSVVSFLTSVATPHFKNQLLLRAFGGDTRFAIRFLSCPLYVWQLSITL